MQYKGNRNRKKIYDGFSMVEMLITLLIMGFVMILVGVTLTALIKASAISSAKTLSRNEREFMFDLLERYIENADPEQILVFNSSGRYVELDGDIGGSANVFESVDQGSDIGNEIHIRPVGSSRWICIAYYPAQGAAGDPDELTGYLLKATSDTLVDHTDCLDPTANPDLATSLIVLNSREIDVVTFEVSYYQSLSENYTFLIDLGIEPVNWVAGESSEFKPIYQDQLVVSTEKVIY